MPYCENCGSPVNPDSKFCRNCGAPQNPQAASPQPNLVQAQNVAPPPSPPVQTPPVQIIVQTQAPQAPQAPANVSQEPIVGVILLRKEKSLGRSDTFTGVLTSQRLIFAQMTSEMLKAAAQQARDQAKAEGKGFFGQWGDQLKATYGYARKYLTMAPQAILAETPGNFELGNSTISEIKIKERFKREDQQIYEFEVQIHSTMGKHEFIMDQNKDYVNLLKQVYGERVKTPFGYFSKNLNIKL